MPSSRRCSRTPTRAQRAELAAKTVREAYLRVHGRSARDGGAGAAAGDASTGEKGSADSDGDEGPVTCPVCFDPLEDPARMSRREQVEV